jgi:hypothetical protein
MTGARGAFSELDTGVYGTVCFGDGSVVCIEGCNTIIFGSRSGEHRVFTSIYYIPRLKTSILSVEQLDELGYEVNINADIMRIKDADRRLLDLILWSQNWLYVLIANIAQPVYYMAWEEEVAWRWHARMGHLGFHSLRKMAVEEWVRGLPKIKQVD